MTDQENGAQEGQALSLDSVMELERADAAMAFGDASFKTTAELEPRPFEELQLRARSACRRLLSDAACQVMLLDCPDESVDSESFARDLLMSLGAPKASVLVCPRRKDLFGDGQSLGLLKTLSGALVLPAALFTDHPKWALKARSCLEANPSLKVIITGSSGDIALLEALWPALDCALRADTELEFQSDGALMLVGRLIRSWKDEGILDCTREAVSLLCSLLSRAAGDRRYIALPVRRMKMLLGEASSLEKSQAISKRSLLKAVGACDYRMNSDAKAALRDHRDSQILIATSGMEVGQINGLSVIETAGTSYVYGEPVRITASMRAGGDGDVIDIERKADLAGQIHAKAMMIINGFLSREFGQTAPLPATASLVFEQSYTEIDGDSASLTGLCAVLSCFADLPIRQDLAVTGAVDQLGDVQPVGGVNEKIEGFFRICRLHGLTGTQGVVIPLSCVPQLMLRPAVADAVRSGRFHIYTVSHVTGAMRILTGVEWGDSETDNTVCCRICDRLDQISNRDSGRAWWHFW
ncbi:MAG: S16 family serine protease [Succinivibrio sp.]